MSRLASTVAALALFTPSFALADVKACVDAHAAGQRDFKAGRLKAAAHRFTTCGAASKCPAEIKAECTQFLREVERDLPTVLLTARDRLGRDVTQSRVYVDDELLAEQLDGRPIALDPGPHTLRFVFASGEVVSETLRLERGARERAVSVTLPESESTSEPTSESAGSTAAPRRAVTAPFWVAAGTSAVGLTSWGVFALLGRGRQAAVEQCAPRCSESARPDYDAMRRSYLISDVSLGVGLAAAGVASWLWLDRPRASTPPEQRRETARLTLVPTLTPSKVELTLRATAF